MSFDLDYGRLQRDARRAYELGRLKHALLISAFVSPCLALASASLLGRKTLGWVPLTFAMWTAIGWRGGALLSSARLGLLAGAASLLLPLSLLRPCCRWDAAGAMSCSMPEACVALGAIIGLPLAALACSREGARRWESAGGVWLGVVSAATFKCSALFAGEALGLLGGVLVGALAAGLLTTSFARRAY